MLDRFRRLFATNVVDRNDKPAVGAHKHGYCIYRSCADPLYSPWLVDEEFRTLMDAIMVEVRNSPGCGVVPDDYRDGRYIQWTLARQAVHLEGDFVEMGVHLGTGSHLFGFALDRYGKGHQQLWSIDSFEGLSEPDERDVNLQNGEHFWRKHSLNNVSVDYVRSMLGQHTCKIHVVQGWIPDVFQHVSTTKVALAHIDVDIFQPTFDALAFLYTKMVPGGMILFDDYGFPMCPGARKAIDEFFSDKRERVIPLPTGQALVIKIGQPAVLKTLAKDVGPVS